MILALHVWDVWIEIILSEIWISIFYPELQAPLDKSHIFYFWMPNKVSVYAEHLQYINEWKRNRKQMVQWSPVLVAKPGLCRHVHIRIYPHAVPLRNVFLFTFQHLEMVNDALIVWSYFKWQRNTLRIQLFILTLSWGSFHGVILALSVRRTSEKHINWTSVLTIQVSRASPWWINMYSPSVLQFSQSWITVQ